MPFRLFRQAGVPPGAAQQGRAQPKPLPGVLTSIGYLLRQWQRHWPQGVLIVGALGTHELFRTYFALQLKRMIDSLQATGQVENLIQIMAILVVGFFVALAARLFGERLIAQTGVKILNHLRLAMFEHLQKLSHSYYTRTPSGNILARFATDLADVEKLVTVRLRDGLLDVILLLLNVPVLFYIDWRLGLVPLVNMLLMMQGVGYLTPLAAKVGYELKASEAQLTSELQENIRGQALIRAFGFEPLMLARFQRHLATLETVGARASLFRALVSLSARSIVLFSRIIAVGIGVLLVMRKEMTLGDFVAFFNLLTLVNNAIDDLTRTVLPDLVSVSSGIQRIQELLDEKPDIVEAANAQTLPSLQQQITVKQLFFSYTGETAQLQDINLVIPAGKTVAIVGPSGSGKSTLLTMLMRGREATSGAILYDGVDIRQLKRASLQQQMAVVFQETYLFETTIRENIRMAKPDATDEEVVNAAKLAEIHEMITRLPNQYETLVGEAGGWLSGGQRQRIAIARAIIRNPAILLLDEATSALDPGTDADITATLRRLGQSRTVITVTHRLSSIMDVDHIVVLNSGRLVEMGSHEQLLANQGLYAQLWHKQRGFEISSDGRLARVHAAHLRQIPLFAALDMAVLTTIADHFTAQFVNQGQVVFHQGDSGDRFYLIARGQVEVLIHNAQKMNQKIDAMSDGDHFGEMALIQEAPRNATIRTLTDCLFLTLPKRKFLDLLGELPSLRLAVDQHMARTIQNRERQQVDETALRLQGTIPTTPLTATAGQTRGG